MGVREYYGSSYTKIILDIFYLTIIITYFAIYTMQSLDIYIFIALMNLLAKLNMF